MTSVTQIATVASGIIQLIEVGRNIYQATVDTMDAIEAKGSLKGKDKKEWVLAFIKNFVYELGENWEKYFILISEFIDNMKAAYNNIKYLIK